MASQMVKWVAIIPLLVVAATGQFSFDVDTAQLESQLQQLPVLKEPSLCENRGGHIGVCTYHYQCKNKVVVTDGSGIIEKREVHTSFSCGEADKVCCPYDMGYSAEDPTSEPESCDPEKGTHCLEAEPCETDDCENKQTNKDTIRYPLTTDHELQQLPVLKEPSLCENRGGHIGVCTYHYQCKNKVVVTDGSGIIEKREVHTSFSCGEADKVCCPYDMGYSAEDPTSEPESCDPEKGTHCLEAEPCETDDCENKQTNKDTIRYPLTTDHEPAEGKGFTATTESPIDINVDVDEGTHEDYEDEIPPCGVRNSSAVAPWLVFIIDRSKVRKESDLFKGSVGGGTLIHPSAVLTVAHVLQADQQLEVMTSGKDRQTRGVKRTLTHERFKNLEYDIAVLILVEPMNDSPYVGMACLPPADSAPPENCLTHEWARNRRRGEPKIKTMLVPVVSHEQCQRRLIESKRHLGKSFKLHQSFMCAGGDHAVEICKWDKGFPLICSLVKQREVRYVLHGMTSWAVSCGKHGDPTVYVNITKLRKWIDEKMHESLLTTDSYTIRDKIRFF